MTKCLKMRNDDEVLLTEKPECEASLHEIETINDDISSKMEKMMIDEGFTEVDGIFKCNYCIGKYKKKGHLKTHLENKHNKIISLSCKCGKVFTAMTKLVRHEKLCK